MSSRKIKLNPEIKKWLAARKAAGRRINPDKAEIIWLYCQELDPYGVYPDLPPEYHCIGRSGFARNPNSEIWVSFMDIPQRIVDKLYQRINIERRSEFEKSIEIERLKDELFST